MDRLMIKPHFMAVAMDETCHFNIGAEEAPFVEKIIGVYAYDQNEVSFLCSAEANYHLIGVHHVVHVKEGTPDEIREMINLKYEVECYPEDFYMESWRVELRPDRLDLSERFDGEDDTLQDVVEFLQGNHQF